MSPKIDFGIHTCQFSPRKLIWDIKRRFPLQFKPTLIRRYLSNCLLY